MLDDAVQPVGRIPRRIAHVRTETQDFWVLDRISDFATERVEPLQVDGQGHGRFFDAEALFGDDEFFAPFALVLVLACETIDPNELLQGVSDAAGVRNVEAQVEKRVERVGGMIAFGTQDARPEPAAKDLMHERRFFYLLRQFAAGADAAGLAGEFGVLHGIEKEPEEFVRIFLPALTKVLGKRLEV